MLIAQSTGAADAAVVSCFNDLSTHLLLVISRVGQKSRDVKHDLVTLVDGVHTVSSGHIP